MSNEKMREEFEAWISRSKVCISNGARVEVRSDGHYTDGRVDLQWKAWKASRSALCVEIPKRDEYAEIPYGTIEIFEVQQALDDEGVRYR